MRPVWKYSMVNQVWTTNQTVKPCNSSVVGWYSPSPEHSPPQEQRTGGFQTATRSKSQEGILYSTWCQPNTYRVVSFLWGVVHSPPVRCPLPGIAHHVVEAVAIGGKGSDLHETGNTGAQLCNHSTQNRVSIPTPVCWRCTLRSLRSRHQLSSAELEHFYILHWHQTGWKTGTTLCPQHPVAVWHSISSLLLETDPLQNGTVWPAGTPGMALMPWPHSQLPDSPPTKEKPQWLPTPACADSSSDETFGPT